MFTINEQTYQFDAQHGDHGCKALAIMARHQSTSKMILFINMGDRSLTGSLQGLPTLYKENEGTAKDMKDIYEYDTNKYEQALEIYDRLCTYIKTKQAQIKTKPTKCANQNLYHLDQPANDNMMKNDEGFIIFENNNYYIYNTKNNTIKYQDNPTNPTEQREEYELTNDDYHQIENLISKINQVTVVYSTTH
ncbi:hypothetical protein L3V82_13230 [Thiotrichales bacterium 19S3-7]|nr:hypothetical protein [Thiotrichales bacterium 19S3-7]MCF6803130.1 hypothetical protein [Thiotrichales bacterium 19S3-11]